jgi:hypothetical protein
MAERGKKRRVVRRKGKCECGLRIRSKRNLEQHAKANGHKLTTLPSKS